MELQPRPKSGNSTRPNYGGSPIPENASSSQLEHKCWKRPEQHSSKRSNNESSQRPRMKYGSRPPESVKSDEELSQWILEAEQEDRRLAAMEQAESQRIMAEKLQLDGLKPSTNKKPAITDCPRFHRGCKYRLPSADPISIPTVPYNPLDKWWLYQEMRRRKCELFKKDSKETKAIRELADAGFDVQFTNDVDDDSDDSEFGERDGGQCPICSISFEAFDQDIEIAVDAVTIITSTNPATQNTEASTTTATGPNVTNRKNGIHFYLQKYLFNFKRNSSVH